MADRGFSQRMAAFQNIAVNGGAGPFSIKKFDLIGETVSQPRSFVVVRKTITGYFPSDPVTPRDLKPLDWICERGSKLG